MKFGDRNIDVVLKVPFQTRHYRSFIRILKVFDHPREALRRYLSAKGSYPWRVTINPGNGHCYSVNLNGHHDLCTVVEIFCRLDYKPIDRVKCCIDIGANIGLASLFVLDSYPDASIYMYEPLPENLARISDNLEVFRKQIQVFDEAVSTKAGEATFHWEPTGRYGTLQEESRSEASDRTITVQCTEINEVIDRALRVHDRIDLLKIDIEGLEGDVINAISPDRLSKIGSIFAEIDSSMIELPNFSKRQYGSICRMINSA